ncbi:MAG: benenodin family lasso peptide [Rudaea sp.]
MKETIDNTQNQDIIELGVASVETMGGGINPGEPLGESFGGGISND